MTDILAVTLYSLHQDMARLDQVADNLANVSTPGFKRQAMAAMPFNVVMNTLAPQSGPATALADPGGRLLSGNMETMVDTHAGTLKSTGASLDVAIEGEGFFEVTTAAGPAYTRQGNFKIDDRGRLVTQNGDPVEGKNGDIFLSGNAPVIDGAGNIVEMTDATGTAAATKTAVGQLKIMKFDDVKNLRHLGKGLLTGDSTMTQLNDGETRILQGSLENSNVSTLQEMMQLTRTLRHFESMQHVAQGYDEIMGTAVQKLGDL